MLRGAALLGGGVIASTILAACTPQTPAPLPSTAPPTLGAPTSPAPSESDSVTGANPIPQDLAVIPEAYWSAAQQQGTLQELSYDTFESSTYEQRTQPLTKRAIVYLPHNYNAAEQYNVFYLMHGGWGNETSTLGTPNSSSDFKNVLDHAIAAAEIQPLIVVCPTYNNTSSDDSGSFSLALTLNENFHRELLNDLLPAVEGSFSSYAEDTTPAALMASRDHRGFGGFSMGAVATWRTFQNGLDYFRYFLPMSCGTSLDMETILAAAENHDPADHFAWVITGTDDFAHPYDEARVALMRSTPLYAEADTEQSGNFVYRVKDGYAHDGTAATEYTYNGLRWFWND